MPILGVFIRRGGAYHLDQAQGGRGGRGVRRCGGTDVVAWPNEEMDGFFSRFSALLDDPAVSYSHKWREGDVVIIDNLAVAHKAAPGAHAAVEPACASSIARPSSLGRPAGAPRAACRLTHGRVHSSRRPRGARATSVEHVGGAHAANAPKESFIWCYRAVQAEWRGAGRS